MASYTKTPTSTHRFFFQNQRGMTVQWDTPNGPSMSFNQTAYFTEADARYMAKHQCNHLELKEMRI